MNSSAEIYERSRAIGEMLSAQITQLKQLTPSASAQTKLHLMHALLRGRIFDGNFEARGESITFTFIPAKATVVDNKLVITGRINFTSAKQPAKIVESITATLMATQGGVGVSPVMRQLLTGTAQTAQTATSDQKLEQEKGPETDLQPGLHSFESPKYDELGRPKIESTDALGFVGVLYFKLSPIDGKSVAVPLDMSDVQLGARLAPTDDLARDLQVLFSDLVMALGNPTEPEPIGSALVALNRALGS